VQVRATRVRRLRIRRAIGRTMLLAAVTAAGSLYLSIRSRDVTLVVDGRPRAVATMEGSVGDLLHAHGIDVDPGDQVVPSPSTAVTGGMTVVVDLDGVGVAASARSSESGVWVVEGTEASVARAIAQLAGGPTLVRGPAGSSSIRSASVVVRGNEHDVLTNASTVGELLSAMGIRPDGDDRVLPPPSSPLEHDSSVRYSDVRVVTRVLRRALPFSVETRESATLPPGEVRVLRDGVRGSTLRRFRVKIVDGEVVGRSLVGTRVARGTVDERRLVGASPSPTGGGAGAVQSGEATWYDPPWWGLTAAHPTLAFGTMVTVTNAATGASVVVRINDRGPYGAGRIIDLSPEAFSQIASLSTGVVHVRISW